MKERAVSAINVSGNSVAVFGCVSGSQELSCKVLDATRPAGNQWLPSQTGWTALGGAFDSTVEPAIRGGQFVNSVDLFGLGLNYGMYHGLLDATWPPVWPPPPVTWPSIGGTFNSPPAAIAWGAWGSGGLPTPNLAVVGLSTDNQAYVSASFPGPGYEYEQTGWVPLGGVLISEVAFDSSETLANSNKFAVLGVGTDAQLYRIDVDGTHWPPALSAWVALGGCFKASPAAVCWGPGRLDVFGLGNNLEMYHRAWNNGIPAGPWEALGGEFDSSPAVVSWGSHRLDIFALQTDSRMYHKAWDGNRWLPSPTDWEALGGEFLSAPAAASYQANRLDVFGLGTNGGMYHKAWDGNQWLPSVRDWEALGGQFRIPKPTVLPSRLDFEADITFPGPVAAGGSVGVTLFSDGTYNFSGHIRATGALAYHFLVACVVIADNRAYSFSMAGYVAGTFEPGSRDYNWGGIAGPNSSIASNWASFFGCGGAQFKETAGVDVDLTWLLETIVTPALQIINVTSK